MYVASVINTKRKSYVAVTVLDTMYLLLLTLTDSLNDRSQYAIADTRVYAVLSNSLKSMTPFTLYRVAQLK